ncbi:MAG TPA: nuclear transport factor 2 family protein [Solirubrobacteraceae bacterium]|nr:nuclear transport factor 2 family protein [Solirubrobacteraceae bacterium]
MDDQQTRELLTRMVTSLDADAEYEMRHDDFVAEIPQSSERIRGRANMRAIQRAFPPDRTPTFRVRRVTGSGDVWTVEAIGNYGAEVYFVVCVFEFRDGRIARETRYYPQPFEAPEWRAEWVEHMDDADAPKPLPS